MSIITQRHIDQYAQEGCVRVEQAFSAEQICQLMAGVDRILKDFPGPDSPLPTIEGTTQNSPTTHWLHGGVQLRNWMHYVPEFQHWLDHSPAAAYVGELMGAQHVGYWQDATFVKIGPSEDATPWHNDVCTFPIDGSHIPSLWIALTDVEAEDGPMKTLAGSNLDPFRYHSPMSRQDMGLIPGYRPWSELIARCEAPDADIRVWTVKAGDLLLIHPKTVHGSEPRSRRDDGRRVAFTSRWVGSDVVWKPDEFSYEIQNLDTSRLELGKPLPEDLFPIRWRRQG